MLAAGLTLDTELMNLGPALVLAICFPTLATWKCHCLGCIELSEQKYQSRTFHPHSVGIRGCCLSSAIVMVKQTEFYWLFVLQLNL